MDSHLFYTLSYGMRVGHTCSYAQHTAATNLVGSLRVLEEIKTHMHSMCAWTSVYYPSSPHTFPYFRSLDLLHLRSFKYRTIHFLSHTPQSSFHTDRGYVLPFPLFLFVLTGSRLLQASYMDVQSFLHSN